MRRNVRWRYLALRVEVEDTFTSKELMDTIWNSVSKLYGEYGASQTGLALIDYNAEEKFAVIRATHVGLENVRTAIAAITKIGNKPAAIHVLTVSGTIKALLKKTKH
ncbi:MAG: Rpp14/Pop5 family protein [Candidatus Bathyarchaeota archaeon]|nr:hypothetical protein [Candidatus Bathyarchaeota archaeon A05DMB-5]MDH7557733.1 Rpp14/Pop5 family protein [Candidatus Bathyarchaeota archaeon]